MANPMEEISPRDGQTICHLISFGLGPDVLPSFYQTFIVKYGKETVDAKISECKASLNLKKKDISSREFLASYRIQQLPRNKMDHFREESN